MIGVLGIETPASLQQNIRLLKSNTKAMETLWSEQHGRSGSILQIKSHFRDADRYSSSDGQNVSPDPAWEQNLHTVKLSRRELGSAGLCDSFQMIFAIETKLLHRKLIIILWNDSAARGMSRDKHILMPMQEQCQPPGLRCIWRKSQAHSTRSWI